MNKKGIILIPIFFSITHTVLFTSMAVKEPEYWMCLYWSAMASISIVCVMMLSKSYFKS